MNCPEAINCSVVIFEPEITGALLEISKGDNNKNSLCSAQPLLTFT
jgi:hypothetical protein